MGSYILKDKFLKVNNIKYYRSNGIQLGDVGTKRSSLFSVNRVDAQSNIPAPKMKVKYGEAITMTSDFASSVASLVTYNGMTGFGFKNQLTNGDLKLVRYYMSNPDIENGIEKSPKLIETIKSIGNDARVVSDVWVVVDAKMYEDTKAGGFFSFNGSSSSGAGLSNSGSTISLSSGSILAYMLQKIDWKEKLKKNWSTIEKLDEDPKGH